MIIPKDWVTGHFDHTQTTYKVGLFKMTKVTCCTCGLSVKGDIAALDALHWQNEMKMRAWLDSVNQKPNKDKGNYFS